MGQKQYANCYVVTETIFAGKEEKKFPGNKWPTFRSIFFEKLPWFPKNFFMCDRPGNAGDRYG